MLSCPKLSIYQLTIEGDTISALTSRPFACIRAAFPYTIPVMTGYLALGTGFGILLYENGYGVAWAALMSVTMYAGSMQYVGAGLLAAPFAPAQVALLTLMVQARHLFYGLPLIERWREAGKTKPYHIFSLTDETFSLLISVETPVGIEPRAFEFWMALLDQSYWIAGSIAGSLIAKALPFDTAGVDFTMTALFIVIFIEQWRSAKGRLPAVIGVASSILCRILFGSQWFLLASMAMITAALIFARGHIEKVIGTTGESAPGGDVQ